MNADFFQRVNVRDDSIIKTPNRQWVIGALSTLLNGFAVLLVIFSLEGCSTIEYSNSMFELGFYLFSWPFKVSLILGLTYVVARR